MLPLIFALLALQTAAPPPAIPPAPPGDVVVRARTEQQVRRAVDALTQSSQGRQVSRWHRIVCATVIGFDERHGAFVAARIASLAASLGLAPASARCQPNVFVLATDDSDGFTEALIKRSPGLFGDPTYGIAHGAVLRDLREPRPVRWVQGSRTVDDSVAEHPYALNSRLSRPTREDLTASIVIVDLNRINGLVWQQLADYVALVSLARPKLTADYGPDTILSLFAARSPDDKGPAGLTAQDQAFLSALYTSQGGIEGWRQRDEIDRRMWRSSLNERTR